MFELIECDVVVIWWYNWVECFGIDFVSFVDLYFDVFVYEYVMFGWCVWVFDIIIDFMVLIVVVFVENLQDGCFLIGFGCYFDGRIVVQWVLIEVNQLFDIVVDVFDLWDCDMFLLMGFLYLLLGMFVMMYLMWQLFDIVLLLVVIVYCVGWIVVVGMDVFVVDKMWFDIGLFVVQVIVFGLCYFWLCFGVWWFYLVLVVLGWCVWLCDEMVLNLVLLFL